MTSILVDRRTGSKDLHTLLPKGYSELTELEFADAVVVGNGPDGVVTEAFERKRLSDSLACLQDSRFAGRQLRGLLTDYDFVWLVIEDEIREDPRTGILQRRIETRVPKRRGQGTTAEGRWVDAVFGAKSTMMWRDYMHWLLSMQRKGGVDNIYFTRNANETAKLIWTVHTWRQKPWKAHRSVDVFSPKSKPTKPMLFTPKGAVKLIIDVTRSFDDVGYDTACAFADHFSGPDEFWHASLEELASVVVTTRTDGAKVRVGKKLAESIVRQRSARR